MRVATEREAVIAIGMPAAVPSRLGKTDAKEIENILDDGATDPTRGRGPAAAPHVETETPTAVVIAEKTANPTAILARARAHTPRNPENLGPQGIQIHHLVALAKPPNETELRLRSKPRPRQTMTPTLSKISSDRSLPAKTRHPSSPAVGAPTNLI